MELRPAFDGAQRAVLSYSEDRERLVLRTRCDVGLSLHDIRLGGNIVQCVFHFVFENALFAMFQIGRECLRMRRLNSNTQSCKLPKKYNLKDIQIKRRHAF
jgi:hypothetical protein